jgi:hypothetical protein
MKKPNSMVCLAVAALFLTATAFAQQGEGGEQGQAVVTVLPAHAGSTAAVPAVDVAVKVDGKQATVTGWTPLNNHPVEMVLLIDGAARSSLGTQFSSITNFVHEMPANMKMAIAYMQNGNPVFTEPLSSDPATVLKALRMPAGPPGISASPYFCLSNLAKKWPSHDRSARREVVVISDGVDPYNVRYNPEDPYVLNAIHDSVRAGLVVYSIYWRNEGRLGRSAYGAVTGQNLMNEVTEATGGYSYWEGFGNPVDFEPYFKDLRHRLDGQYQLSFTAPLNGKAGVESLHMHLNVPSAKVDAPQQVYVSAEEAMGAHSVQRGAE